MLAKEEVGEIQSLIACNGSASKTNETGLQLYLVSKCAYGDGLPYIPVD